MDSPVSKYLEQKKRTEIIPIAVVSILLICGVGYFAYMRFFTIQESSLNHQNLLNSSASPEGKFQQDRLLSGHIDTSDWKAYIDNEVGFAFQYPEKYFLQSKNDTTGSEMSSSVTITKYRQPGREAGEIISLKIFLNPNHDTVLGWLASTGQEHTVLFNHETRQPLYEYFPVSIAGLNGIQFSMDYSGIYVGYESTVTIFGNDTYIFEFHTGRFSKNDSELKKDTARILSSFKLL